MGSFEISGKSVEDAIQRAMDELGITKQEINYTVLKEGKQGILGIGAEEARILVETSEPRETEDELTLQSKGILEELLKLMGFNATVAVERALPIEDSEAGAPVTFNITGDDDVGILIGRHGQTIASLQYILRVMITHRIKTSLPIIVDVDGYKQRRYEALRITARRLAEQVKTRRIPFTLEPMPAFERRIIHITLANDSNVTTQSIGEGESRKVVISPKNQGKAPRTIINR